MDTFQSLELCRTERVQVATFTSHFYILEEVDPKVRSRISMKGVGDRISEEQYKKIMSEYQILEVEDLVKKIIDTSKSRMDATRKIFGSLSDLDISLENYKLKKKLSEMLEMAPFAGNDKDLIDVNQFEMERILRSKIFIDLNSKASGAIIWDPLTGEKEFVEYDLAISLLPEGETRKNYLRYKVAKRKFVYEPHIDAIEILEVGGVESFNIYNPPNWKRKLIKKGIMSSPEKKNLPKVYIIFFRHIFSEDEKSIEYCLLWLAYSLIGKNPTCLGLFGAKGIGKNVFAERICIPLHGSSNSVVLTGDFYSSRFQGELENKTLGIVDEVNFAKNGQREKSNFKRLTNDVIGIEPKNKTPKKIKNYVNFLMSGNDLDLIPWEKDDRRLSLLCCTDVKLKDTDLIHYLDELSDPDNIAELAEYLLSLNVTYDQIRIPYQSPEVIRKIEELNIKEWEGWAIDYINQKIKDNDLKINITEFQNTLLEEFPGWKGNPPGRDKIKFFLKKHFPSTAEIKKPTGKGERFISLKGQ